MRKTNVHMSFLSFLWIVSLLFLTIVVPASTAKTMPLRDISDSYAEEQILSLVQAGVVVGDPDGYFHPQQPVKRAEFVALLNRTLGIRPVSGQIQAYTDVPKYAWAYGDVQASAALGIVNGTSVTSFAPNRTITRQEAAVIIMRALGKKPNGTASLPVADSAQVSAWAKPYVSEALKSELLVGYEGYFRPNAPLSREETAVILHRVLTRLDKQPAKPSVVLGWQYQTTTQEFLNLVNGSPVNTLSPRWFFLKPDGSVSDSADPSLVHWAHEKGKRVWPLFGNRFDAKATHEALSTPAKRDAIVDKLVSYVEKYQLDGINIDFESMNADDRDVFTAFVRELSSALQAKGAVVSVDVPPDLHNDWSAPYDYAALAQHADYLVLMAYEEHWSGGPKAGSVSSLPWLADSVTDLIARIPAGKLIVGLPLYTRDWYQSNGKWLSTDLTIPESYRLVSSNGASVRWDPSLGQYRASYRKNGVSHSIWMEESRSLGRKLETSLNWPVAGFAFWYVGTPVPDIWTAVSNAFTLQQVRQNVRL
jgi:spore germination protein